MAYESIEKILDLAMLKEQEAHDFYMRLAQTMARPVMKEVFEQFAREELGHKKKLQAVKQGGKLLISEKKIVDLGIAEYIVDDTGLSADMTYQQALITAMNAEKRAFRLYSDLASKADDPGVRDLFLSLAQEEAKHKLRFEIEYDDHVLTEN